jgi:hypothetical protein
MGIQWAVLASVLFSAMSSAATPAEQALKQQVDKLQAQNAAQDKMIANLQAELKKSKGNDGADEKTIATLRQQVEQLQAELKKAKGNDTTDDKTIVALRQQVEQLQSELKKIKGSDQTNEKALLALQQQLDVLRKVKIVRTIVFKPKADTSKTEIQSLADDANQFFATSRPVRGVWAGRAAADAAEYQVVIVLLFDDANGLQVFQGDAQWKRFIDKHAKMWDEPRYFDGTIGK